MSSFPLFFGEEDRDQHLAHALSVDGALGVGVTDLRRREYARRKEHVPHLIQNALLRGACRVVLLDEEIGTAGRVPALPGRGTTFRRRTDPSSCSSE